MADYQAGKRYAQAAFAIAKEAGTVATWRARSIGNRFGSYRGFAFGRKAQTADKEKHHACNEEG